MRDPSSYDRDPHTIVVNSLEDDSDIEASEDEPRFLFNLPAGSIDTTFSGVKGLSSEMLQRLQDPRDGQLVLYKGPAEEVIGRTLTAAKQSETSQSVSHEAAAQDGNSAIENDAMDLD